MVQKHRMVSCSSFPGFISLILHVPVGFSQAQTAMAEAERLINDEAQGYSNRFYQMS